MKEQKYWRNAVIMVGHIEVRFINDYDFAMTLIMNKFDHYRIDWISW